MGHQPKTLSRLVWMSKTESFMTESYACEDDEPGPIFCKYTEPGVKLHQSLYDASHYVVPVSGVPRAASSDHEFSAPCCSPPGYENSSFQRPRCKPTSVNADQVDYCPIQDIPN
jgi:hypothetical protein